MIAAWILYATVVGLFLSAGAWVVERLLRAHRLPTRWVWAGAMGLSLGWPVVPLAWEFWPRASAPIPIPPPSRVAALEPLAVQVGEGSILRALDGPILAGWLFSSLALLVFFGFLVVRTRRLRKGWAGEKAAGHPVLFSEDLGPAVVGYLRPQIVLPAWCKDLEDQTLRMVIDHELEHLRAGDLRLLLSASLLPLLFPWHLPVWWQLRRLRMAVEGDCDLRVVRKHPDRIRPYMELLLEVGGRAPRAAALVAMLSEPEKTLAQRIRIMTMPFPKKPWMRGALLAVAGGVLTAVACWAPSPREADGDAADAADAAAVASSAVPEASFPAPDPRSETVEISIPPNPRELADLAESPGDAGPDTPVEALGHFFRVSFDTVKSWVRGILAWLFGNDAVGPAAGSSPESPADANAAGEGELSGAPAFTPYTVRPDITNRDQVARALEAEYPPLLKDAGVGGTAEVWFFVDKQGRVANSQINKSSGHEALDDAALRVANTIEFTPALNRDQRVPVWISLPITFTTRSDRGQDAAGEGPGYPPPPGLEPNRADLEKAPTFTPYTVRPDIRNRTEVARALEEEYPPLLREAGVGGTVQVWLFVDETGDVGRVQVNESSGHRALDDAALRVAESIEFTPALNQEKAVPVWISLPITFTTR